MVLTKGSIKADVHSRDSGVQQVVTVIESWAEMSNLVLAVAAGNHGNIPGGGPVAAPDLSFC